MSEFQQRILSQRGVCTLRYNAHPGAQIPLAVDITFRRTGPEVAKGVPGEITIGNKSWPTIERGGGYTYARQGNYTLKMDTKNTGRKVACLRFDHDGIRTHLIHDALSDNHFNLQGCIAPGLKIEKDKIVDSAKAMQEIWLALGGWIEGSEKTIKIENNLTNSTETGRAWMTRRQKAGKW